MSRVKTNSKLSAGNGVQFMKRSVTMSALLTCIAIAGCASHQKDHTTVNSIPGDYRTNHPIVVANSEHSRDLIVVPTMRTMSHRHRNIVTDFVGKFKSSGAKSINLMLPAGSHNETAARHIAASAVKYMKTLGIHEGQVKIERYHASNHGDSATIRMVFGSLGAHVDSECGQWTENLVDNPNNENYQNFGCATQNNLAQMIANPADLIGPRGESEIDAERRDNVISNWRENGTSGNGTQ